MRIMSAQIFNKIKKIALRFDRDESALSSLEVVMILAISAMVVAVIIVFAKEIIAWCARQLKPEL